MEETSSEAKEPVSDPATPPSLADQKLAAEILKLTHEAAKLKSEVDELGKPYLWRNPQVLPTAIAALGAIIGLGVGLYANYFTAIQKSAEADQKEAKSARENAEADQKAVKSARESAKRDQLIADNQKKAADVTMREALDTERAEETKKREAQQIIDTENENITAANIRYQYAVDQANRAEKLNAAYKSYLDLRLFHAATATYGRTMGLSEFICKQQDQFDHLRLIDYRISSYSWLTNPHLESLTIGNLDKQITMDLTSLRTINPSINDLNIEAIGPSSIDLSTLAGVESIKHLGLHINTSGLKAPPEIRNLHLAKNLEA
jgi:hypothetical protein